MMKCRSVLFAIFMAAVLAEGVLCAQNEVRFSLVEVDESLEAGTSFTVTVEAAVGAGWHLYSMDIPPGGPVPTQISVVENEAFLSGGTPNQPTPIEWFDQNFNMQTNYFEGKVEFEVPVAIKSSASAGAHNLQVKVRFMVCNDSSCLPPRTISLETPVEVVAATSAAPENLEASAAPPESVAAKPVPIQDSETNQVSDLGDSASDVSGLPLNTLAYIWFAMTMGALAL
jgi:thiol:disulfide interchange protein DsbD